MNKVYTVVALVLYFGCIMSPQFTVAVFLFATTAGLCGGVGMLAYGVLHNTRTHDLHRTRTHRKEW